MDLYHIVSAYLQICWCILLLDLSRACSCLDIADWTRKVWRQHLIALEDHTIKTGSWATKSSDIHPKKFPHEALKIRQEHKDD